MKKLLIKKEDHEAFKEIAQRKGMKMYALFSDVLADLKYNDRNRR